MLLQLQDCWNTAVTQHSTFVLLVWIEELSVSSLNKLWSVYLGACVVVPQDGLQYQTLRLVSNPEWFWSKSQSLMSNHMARVKHFSWVSFQFHEFPEWHFWFHFFTIHQQTGTSLTSNLNVDHKTYRQCLLLTWYNNALFFKWKSKFSIQREPNEGMGNYFDFS